MAVSPIVRNSCCRELHRQNSQKISPPQREKVAPVATCDYSLRAEGASLPGTGPFHRASVWSHTVGSAKGTKPSLREVRSIQTPPIRLTSGAMAEEGSPARTLAMKCRPHPLVSDNRLARGSRPVSWVSAAGVAHFWRFSRTFPGPGCWSERYGRSDVQSTRHQCRGQTRRFHKTLVAEAGHGCGEIPTLL
jgi:hypothetical protein